MVWVDDLTRGLTEGVVPYCQFFAEIRHFCEGIRLLNHKLVDASQLKKRNGQFTPPGGLGWERQSLCPRRCFAAGIGVELAVLWITRGSGSGPGETWDTVIWTHFTEFLPTMARKTLPLR